MPRPFKIKTCDQCHKQKTMGEFYYQRDICKACVARNHEARIKSRRQAKVEAALEYNPAPLDVSTGETENCFSCGRVIREGMRVAERAEGKYCPACA